MNLVHRIRDWAAAAVIVCLAGISRVPFSPVLYRDEIGMRYRQYTEDITINGVLMMRKGDFEECPVLGPLKCKWLGVRMPLWTARVYMWVRRR